jgi:hypothetical protein
MLIFSFLSVGIAISMIQQRKDSENAMCQTLAQATAEGILDQVRRAGFTTLSDFTASAVLGDYPYTASNGETATDASGTYVTYCSLPIAFIGVTNNNYAEVQEFNLYWAGNAATLCDVGARSDASDITSLIFGVLMDVDYKDSGGNIIRPRRYMKMRVGITRVLNTNKDAVEVTLCYRWAKPDVPGGGASTYYSTRSLRTVISKISTY